MVSERDYLSEELANSIPATLLDAMSTGQRDVVRGLTAMANTMWQITNPVVRLVELIAEARRQDERYLFDVHNEVMNSIRGQEIVEDFMAWGFLNSEIDQDGEPRYTVPVFWDDFVNPADAGAPDMGIESIGRLLGLCSLARHADQRLAIGISSYAPVIVLIQRVSELGGRINRDDAESLFNRHAGQDAGRKWYDLLHADGERILGQRLFVDTTADALIVNPDAIRAVTLIRERTNERFRALGLGP